MIFSSRKRVGFEVVFVGFLMKNGVEVVDRSHLEEMNGVTLVLPLTLVALRWF